MHAELLSEAARDARRRATAYAEALVLHLGEVELISETPIAAEPLPGRGVMMAMDSAPRAKGAEMAVSEGLVELTRRRPRAVRTAELSRIGRRRPGQAVPFIFSVGAVRDGARTYRWVT